MQKVKLIAIRFHELATVIDSVPLSELKTTKEIRLSTNLVKDIVEGIKDYTEVFQSLQSKKLTLLPKYRLMFDQLPQEMSTAEKDAEAAKLNNELEAEAKQLFPEESAKLEEFATKELEIELSDEKMELLKSLFNTYGAKSYKSKAAYVQVADALGIE